MVDTFRILLLLGAFISFISLIICAIAKKRVIYSLLSIWGCFVLFFISFFVFPSAPDDELDTREVLMNSNESIETKELTTQKPTESPATTEKPTQPPATTENPTEPPATPENIIEIDYVLLRNDYSDEKYKGKWVKIIGEVKTMNYMKPIYFESEKDGDTSNYISITIDGEESASDKFNNGEIVSVIGLIDNKDFFGTVNIKSAIIAKATNDDIAKITEYANVRAQIEIQSQNDYINKAAVIDYENFIRRPDDYKGEIIQITVKITQVFENDGWLSFLYEKGYAGTQNGDEWVIKYELPSGASRIIEGDTVTFYGEFDGLQERTRLFGDKAYIPHLIAKFYK